jgi:hypothetical protein
VATKTRPSVQTVIDAFLERRSYERTILNTSTDGEKLRLWGNVIAEWRITMPHQKTTKGISYELWITTAGWESRLTIDRLNYLPGVRLSQMGKQLYQGGKAWDGAWLMMGEHPVLVNA